MNLDVALALRDLDLEIVEGRTHATWRLHEPGAEVELEPSPPVEHLDSRTVTRLTRGDRRKLLVGRTASPKVVARALGGELDVLTLDPPRLIYQGRLHEPREAADTGGTARNAHRPSWARWVVERYLILANDPTRQRAIADLAQVTQQSVSKTARHLGDLVTDTGSGLRAPNRRALLDHWSEEYSGPGGLFLGWYSLESARSQALAAVEAAQVVDARALVSGDIAADLIAPWKLPNRALVYLDRPIDLENDGLVPAPLSEATLTTCIPEDPTLWRLVSLAYDSEMSQILPLADPAMIYRDLRSSPDADSEEAATHLAAVLFGGHYDKR